MNKLLRVGLDARCLNRPFVRGMGRYVKNVTEVASHLGDIEWRFFADRPDLPFHAPDGVSSSLKCFELRGDRFNSWEQVGLSWQARRAGIDVLHCTATSLPWWQPVPTVVTVHDLIPWMHEWDEGNSSWYWNRLVPAALAKCAAIIAISESTAADIGKRWPSLAPKTHVIPHGVEETFRAISPAPLDEELLDLGVKPPYFLYVGGGIQRKRFDWALRSITALNVPDVQLVACGLEEGVRRKLDESSEGRCKVTACGYVGDALMARLYQNAVAVLYPTLYEGFGFPAVEAQAVGTPVLFSGVSSLAELVGPAAFVLPVDDFDAWVATCRQLLEVRRVLPMPNEDAREWTRRFSWRSSAEKHLAVYRGAATVSRRKLAAASNEVRA